MMMRRTLADTLGVVHLMWRESCDSLLTWCETVAAYKIGALAILESIDDRDRKHLVRDDSPESVVTCLMCLAADGTL